MRSRRTRPRSRASACRRRPRPLLAIGGGVEGRARRQAGRLTTHCSRAMWRHTTRRLMRRAHRRSRPASRSPSPRRRRSTRAEAVARLYNPTLGVAAAGDRVMTRLSGTIGDRVSRPEPRAAGTGSRLRLVLFAAVGLSLGSLCSGSPAHAAIGARTPVAAAVADPARPAADRARDALRKPASCVELAGVHPGMTMAELIPGRGIFHPDLQPGRRSHGACLRVRAAAEEAGQADPRQGHRR